MAAAETLARDLAEEVGRSSERIDLVLGIANGGTHPAYHVAQALGLPFRTYRVQRGTTRLKERVAFARKALRQKALRPLVYLANRYADRWLTGVKSGGDTLNDVRGKHVLIVDDCIDSGATIALVRSALIQRGAAGIRIAVFCWSTKYDSLRQNGVAPDYWLYRSLASYPWSADNPDFDTFRSWLQRHTTASKFDS